MDSGIQFIGKDVDDNEINVTVIKPTQRILQKSQRIYNLELSKLIRNAATDEDRLLFRSELREHLKTIGVWTADDAKLFLHLQMQVRDLELKLQHGDMKVSEGKEIALQMIALRQELWSLYMKRSQFDSITIEATAENYKFNFMVSKCVVDTDSKLPIFDNADDYIDKAHWPVAVRAAEILASMVHGLDVDGEKKVPEQIWLREFKFVNENSELIDDKGRLIDYNGKLVDEHGRFINENGDLIDMDGNIVDDKGHYAFEPKPFIDDITGKKIILKQDKAEK